MATATMLENERRRLATAMDHSVVAYGSARLTMPELADIRKESILGLSAVLSPQLLRHSDEQTLAALVATSNAIRRSAVTNLKFEKWGIVCSSRNLGRSAFAAVIDKYRSEGPWGVSVQVIPHCTAHAVAGTISLALGSHGPCIGVGSAGDNESEALMSAASVLRQTMWDGVWIVLSSWLPELSVGPCGRPTNESTCFAAAIGVTRGFCEPSLGRISIDTRDESLDEESSSASLIEYLAASSHDGHSWSESVSDAVRISIDLADADDFQSHEESTDDR